MEEVEEEDEEEDDTEDEEDEEEEYRQLCLSALQERGCCRCRLPLSSCLPAAVRGDDWLSWWSLAQDEPLPLSASDDLAQTTGRSRCRRASSLRTSYSLSFTVVALFRQECIRCPRIVCDDDVVDVSFVRAVVACVVAAVASVLAAICSS